ncbi:Imm39 family immunity protein [Acidovorax sp. LjRoot129]|uniref:Imm39 family immunity protein n=1 Tax=Acidovorax sp. LjRoot129 TaxID=3342260 RepID=UPI003F50CB8A
MLKSNAYYRPETVMAALTGGAVTEVRNLIVGAVGLIKCRIKGDGQAALAARNALEPELVEHKFLATAPFKSISLILRYGESDDLNPEIGPINAKGAYLPVAVELNARRLEKLDVPAMTDEFRSVMIDVLCDVAANFDLPHVFLDGLRQHDVSAKSRPNQV